MAAEFRPDTFGQGDGPGLFALRQTEDQAVATEDLDLPPDIDNSAKEIDILDCQTKRLALTQSKSRPQRHRDPVLGWQHVVIEGTHSDGHGTTLRRDVAGRVTELALQGFLAIMSSSTAAEKMADTLEKMTRR